MNAQLLKGIIKIYDGSQAVLAKAMGISHSRLNAKINERNGAEFSLKEIVFIRDRYKLTKAQLTDIFFSQ